MADVNHRHSWELAEVWQFRPFFLPGITILAQKQVCGICHEPYVSGFWLNCPLWLRRFLPFGDAGRV